MNQIKFILTMDKAVELLHQRVITPKEYSEFLMKMVTKYGACDLQILYQIKLDMFLSKRVNTDAKGDALIENNEIATLETGIKKEESCSIC